MTRLPSEEMIKLVEEPLYRKYRDLLERKAAEAIEREKERELEKQREKERETASRRNSDKDGSTRSKAQSTSSVHLTEAQRDRRTVFAQQLSVRCTDRDLADFFSENKCPVRNARIVYDKYTRKSKGVAYVEFYEEETVKEALKLSGKKLLGVPVMVELTETEKNRIAEEAAKANLAINPASNSNTATQYNSNTSVPSTSSYEFVRLYAGSLHPSLTELELEQLFEPFGELDSVELLRDESTGASKGVAFIQYKRGNAAKAALEALHGFELAGKTIRLGPVRVDAATISSSKKPLPSQLLKQQHDQNQDKESRNEDREGVDEDVEVSLDPRKRAELMQKLALRNK